MLLTHVQVTTTIDRIVRPEVRGEIDIHPDHSSSSKPPDGFDTPEYWQIFSGKFYVATIYNENYRRRIPRVNIRKRVFGDLPRPLASVEPGLQRDNPDLYSALEELTNKRIYSEAAINGAQLAALRAHV